MAFINLNMQGVEPDSGNVGPVPEGWYNVMIDESDLKPNNSGTGSYIKLRFTIIDGPCAGRKIFNNYNIQHPNQQTVDIAMRQLSALFNAIGLIQIQQTEELHGKPLKVRVKIRPASGDYGASNDITAVRSINDVIVEAATPQAAQAPVAHVPQPQMAPTPPAAPATWAAQAPQATAPAAPPVYTAPQPPAAPQQPWATTPQVTQPAATQPANPAPVQPAPANPAAAAVANAAPPWATQ